jgi:hypothetical protein
VEAIGAWRQRLEDTTLAPIRRTTVAYYAWVAVLVAIIAWGGFAYYVQLRDGLVVTGMRDRISWGSTSRTSSSSSASATPAR